MRGSAIALGGVFALACSRGPVPPALVDTKGDQCAWCRMAVSDLRFAAQITAPLEEPRIFDDLGCLRDYLAGDARTPREATAYVADHRTKAWVDASAAVYAVVPGLATPMSSGLVAWSDAASRAADPDAAGAEPLSVASVFRKALPPGGKP